LSILSTVTAKVSPYTSINICETKESCQLQAVLAKEKAEEYLMLPREVTNMIPRIRDVQMKGARSNDKDLKAQKYQRETATRARQKT